MSARDLLTRYVGMLEQVHLVGAYRMEAFVLRHADVETRGRKLPRGFKRGTPKQCFQNATHLSARNGLAYCEGYVVRDEMPLAIHHAWCVNGKGEIVDNTLVDPELCDYIGVLVPRPLLIAELARTGVYGLLDTGCGYNVAFMQRYEKSKRTR